MTPAADIRLSSEERQLILAYRELHEECREIIFYMAVEGADDSTLRRHQRPALRLIAGGGK